MANKNKTVVILDHNGGRLGNQLWNFAHVFAYCLERNYRCRNICFYDYERFYNTVSLHPVLDLLWKHMPGRAKRKIHVLLNTFIQKSRRATVLHADTMNGDQAVRFYLPPTENKNLEQRTILQKAEEGTSTHIYCAGWAFRNPVGIEKYHKQITEYLRPKATISKAVEEEISKLRLRFHSIIGVHIRQGDYREYAGGKFYFSPNDVRAHLDSYLKVTKKDALTTLFYICSDEPIHQDVFAGLQYHVGSHGPVGDIHALSLSDRIIASDSTLSGYAAWYGDVPITLFSRSAKTEQEWHAFEAAKKFDYNYGSYNLQP